MIKCDLIVKTVNLDFLVCYMITCKASKPFTGFTQRFDSFKFICCVYINGKEKLQENSDIF